MAIADHEGPEHLGGVAQEWALVIDGTPAAFSPRDGGGFPGEESVAGCRLAFWWGSPSAGRAHGGWWHSPRSRSRAGTGSRVPQAGCGGMSLSGCPWSMQRVCQGGEAP